MHVRIASLVSGLVVFALASTPLDAPGQFVSATVAAGANPSAVAVDPVANKVFVVNEDSNDVTVIDGRTNATSTVAAGASPFHVAVDPERRRAYVSNIGDGSTTVIDTHTGSVVATLPTGVSGPIAMHPHAGRVYQLRTSLVDEVNIIVGDSYLHTTATLSYQPVAIAVNPVTNRLYVAHFATSDVVAMDMSADPVYAPRDCPDGNGGMKPHDPDNHNPGACIDVQGSPVALAVNPVTNRVYALSNTGEISIIVPPNNAFTSHLPPGGALPGARAIAVNPLTNKIYAAYGQSVVIMDGATLAMQVVPAGSGAGGPVAIAINVLTDKVYVPNADGTLTVIDGATGSTSTLSIPAGAKGIALNPVTNKLYVVGSAVTVVEGAPAGPPASPAPIALSASITPLPEDSSAKSGSISITAASTMPAPLNAVRKVYFQLNGGSWALAEGSGPYTAAFSDLTPGTNVIRAFATNGLEMPSLHADMATVPITSNVAEYTFTVRDRELPSVAVVAPDGSAAGQPVTISANVTGPVGTATGVVAFRSGSFTITGCESVPLSQGVASCTTANLWAGTHALSADYGGDGQYGSASSVPRAHAANGAMPAPRASRTDFNGDGRADIVWQHSDGTTSLWLMDGSTPISSTALIGAGTGWAPTLVDDFNGDARADILWQHADGRTAMWLMNGATQIGGTALFGAGTGWSAAFTGDFDGNGKADIVWRHADGRVAMWLMDGARQAGGAGLIAGGTGWLPKFAADVNGDGRDDIVWTHADGTASLWLMNGASQAGGARLIGAGTGWSPVASGDVNADGRADLAWQHSDGRSALWLMNGTAQVGGTALAAAGGGFTLAGLPDLNRDGKADVLFQRTDGAIDAWLMNGASALGKGRLADAGSGLAVRRSGDFAGDGSADPLAQAGNGLVRMLQVANASVTPVDLVAAGSGWSPVVLPD